MPQFSSIPSFKVEPQPISNASVRTRQEQQTVFKSDQLQYRHNHPKATSGSRPHVAETKAVSYSRNVRFIDPKTQKGFTPRQFKPDERPAKRAKVVRYGHDKKERSFTVRRPLKVQVPMDAWELIFLKCDLPFLIGARLVCREFRNILDRQSIWRTARLRYFGDGLPDCPANITEVQYAILLVGRGCQIAPCIRRDTRKVYWPFMRRICDTCFGRVTEIPDNNSDEAKLYAQLYRQSRQGEEEDEEDEEDREDEEDDIPAHLAGLLPAGSIRSHRWAGPRPLDENQNNWRRKIENIAVISTDYEALKHEFSEKIGSNHEDFLPWAKLKWSKAREIMRTGIILDETDLIGAARSDDLRGQKMVYFGQQASQLDPPIKPKVLVKFAAYQAAIDTPNAASLRSWDILRTKIDTPALRAQAEQLVKWDEDALDWSDVLDDDIHTRLHRHRGNGRYRNPKEYAPEQEVVIKIAQRELKDLLDVVHDEDVQLMLLDRVRKAYEALEDKPDGLNGDGSEGTYRLTLDDALMVVQDVLTPALAPHSTRTTRILDSLRCMGCTRSGSATTYEFHDLIVHIRKVHAKLIVKDAQWYRLALPVRCNWRFINDRVAWYRVEWFKSMPALPNHRKPWPGIVWDPDVETDYIQHEQSTSTPKVFDQVVCSRNTKIPIDDFTSNFCRAVRLLMHTRLESLFIIKVALEYAKKQRDSARSILATSNKLNVSQLQNLEAACAKITSKLEFAFVCKVCTQEAEDSRQKARSPKRISLESLQLHFELCHRNHLDKCMMESIVLPSDSEFMAKMDLEDGKLELEKNSFQKRDAADPRTTALLRIPSIRSCFEKLFVHIPDERA